MRRGERLHSGLPEERSAAASLHKAIRGPCSPQKTGDALLMLPGTLERRGCSGRICCTFSMLSLHKKPSGKGV